MGVQKFSLPPLKPRLLRIEPMRTYLDLPNTERKIRTGGRVWRADASGERMGRGGGWVMTGLGQGVEAEVGFGL